MNFKKYFPLFFLFLFTLALLLRLYRLNDLFIFNFDDEYQANLAWSLVKDFHPIWIGVSASFTDFYLGPYFTYFTAGILFLSKGDPILTADVAAITGVITTCLIFFIGWKFFNPLVGFVAGLLYATLPLFVFYDQRYWNPMFNLWVILLMLLSLILIKKSPWWWVFYIAVIGVMFNTHLAPAPLLLVGIWQFIKTKAYKNLKLILICFVVFLLFYWPLIVFDVNHNYSNMTALFRSNKAVINIQSKSLSVIDSLGRFWYLSPGNPNSDELTFSCTSLSFPKAPGYEIDKFTKRTYGNFWLKILSVSILVWFVYFTLKSKDRNIKLLFNFSWVLLISYLLYPGGSFEYYNLGFLCIFTLIVGLFVSSLPKKLRYFLLGLIVFNSFLGINTIINSSGEFGLTKKRILISQVMQEIGNNPFTVEASGLCHDYEGWRYLFKAFGRTPTHSFTDKNFGWIYPDELTNVKSVYTVTIIENRIPNSAQDSSIKEIKSGGFSADIKINQ